MCKLSLSILAEFSLPVSNTWYAHFLFVQTHFIVTITYLTCTHIPLILTILTPEVPKHLLHLTVAQFQLLRTGDPGDPSIKNAGSKTQRTNAQHS